jgi:hypothetical protein
MKKKNGLLQTFFYDFLKIQVTKWVREILVTCENQLSTIYWFLLRYTVIIYKFTQGNLGAKKIANSRFQSPVKKKNRKLRHWRQTAWSLNMKNSKSKSEKCTIKFRNMTQQKTAWFVQYKDNREIIVVQRIICYLNPFTTTKFFISILKWCKINAKIYILIRRC